jgi:hypothetical protein
MSGDTMPSVGVTELEPFANGRRVLLIASDSRQGFSDHKFERAGSGGPKHRLNAGAQLDRSAGNRAVLENGDDLIAVAGGVFPAERDLIVDRPIALKIRRKPRIDCRPPPLRHFSLSAPLASCNAASRARRSSRLTASRARASMIFAIAGRKP